MSLLVEEIEKLITPELEQAGLELVDLSYQKSHGGWTLSLFLDKPGGFTLQDCAEWSTRLGSVIDASNLIDRSYVLEVASPGLDRALRKLKDFQRFTGENVHAKLTSPIDGQRNFHGQLLGADETSIRMRLDDKREVTLPRELLAKVRLNPAIKF